MDPNEAPFSPTLAALAVDDTIPGELAVVGSDSLAEDASPQLSHSRRTSSDNGVHSTTTSQDNDSPSSGESPVPKPAPMRNISRERKRAELATLRQEAEALERQRNLLLLKRKHQSETVLHSSGQWARAAETERVTRERAETENNRLVEMLQQQIGLSRVLEAMLHKRMRVGGDDDSDEPPERSVPTSWVSHEISIGMLHAQFSRDIQRVYKAGIDRVFTGEEWSPAIAELGLSVVREEKIDPITNTRMVEMRQTRHVPFEYERVRNAMWRCALQPFAEHGRVIESYGSPENQIAVKYRAATPGNMDRGDLLTAVMVLQEFKESDRTVHVWRIMSSSTEERPAESQRAFSDETGWSIIEPVPTGIPGLEPGTAIVRLVAQLVPLWPLGDSNVDASSRLKADDFHDLVVEASCEDMVALADAIGNLLLDESLGLASDMHLL